MANVLYRVFVKLERYASSVLFLVILLFALSGFGMTKGIISADVARSLHFTWLFPIGLVAFVIHTGWGIHLTMKRWRIWNKATATLLALFYLALVAAGIYVKSAL